MKNEEPTARELIVGIRGEVPDKCSFCEQLTPSDDLHPEEGGDWACITCIRRWRAQGEQILKVTPVPGEPTRYFVSSESRAGLDHIVDSDFEGSWSCGCEQVQAKGFKICKHIRAVQLALYYEKNRQNPFVKK